MGGITSLVTTALPAVSTVAGTVGKFTDSSTSAQAQREVDERKYAYEAQKQQLEWQREDALRRQDQELQRQKDEQARVEAEQQRTREMDWLAQSQNQAADQLRSNQATDMADKQGSAPAQLAQINANAAAEERRRVDALRRTMARTRATLGASGVSAADGSGEAILLGAVNDSAMERQDAGQIDQIKRQAIQQELDNARRRNLLEQAQLADRQRLEFMSKFY
ncbi:hypothetical protein [Azospirillum canadense]|uniref:hypothetical protein n=1 Tax=Azospirillum canadense TaxID=403962 RepID=UPI0022272F30|nr:hypothetical protein [Azospirillum canadense]MCW2237896.1 uncharacterized protein (DUF3084 family) [Azospirillum canadense]